MSNLGDYLNSLSNQDSKVDKNIVVIENPTVKSICEKYTKWLELIEKPLLGKDILQELESEEFIKELIYSPKDVRVFSCELKKYETHRYFHLTGIFLSSLINNIGEEAFEIYTKHLNNNIDVIGNYNKKLIKVIGNCGSFIGRKMSGGKIVIEGNADSCIGTLMTGGEIHVSGKIWHLGHVDGGRIYQKGKLVWPR